MTFLEEDLPTDEINLIKDVEEKHQTLSKSYAVGATPDAECAKDMVTVSYESITIPLAQIILKPQIRGDEKQKNK